jgi:hypothetical protein
VSLAALLPALLFAPTGCAFTDMTVQPPHPGQVLEPSSIGRGREVVIDAPFADARQTPERCGMKKNGYNTDTADVHCAVRASDWITAALIDGLSASGFHVLVNYRGAAPSSPRIDGQLVQFFVEPKLDFFTYTPEADIAVTLHVSTPSGLSADRVFYFKAGETRFIGTDDTFQDAVDASTKRAVSGMVGAIAQLLDRYPELGARPAPVAISMNTGVATNTTTDDAEGEQVQR